VKIFEPERCRFGTLTQAFSKGVGLRHKTATFFNASIKPQNSSRCIVFVIWGRADGYQQITLIL
jgi:hypothetical protein